MAPYHEFESDPYRRLSRDLRKLHRPLRTQLCRPETITLSVQSGFNVTVILRYDTVILPQFTALNLPVNYQ